jgi:hypothetical protein
MRCCSLALVLIRRLSDASQKVLHDATRGSKRKPSSLDLQQNEDDKEADENAPISTKTDQEKEHSALLRRIDNVKQQVSALLSFKEALCSGKSHIHASSYSIMWQSSIISYRYMPTAILTNLPHPLILPQISATKPSRTPLRSSG